MTGNNADYVSCRGEYRLTVAWRDRDESGRPVRLIAAGIGRGGERGLFELRELAQSPGGDAEAVLYALSPYRGRTPVTVARLEPGPGAGR
jgi:hypothetical protein